MNPEFGQRGFAYIGEDIFGARFSFHFLSQRLLSPLSGPHLSLAMCSPMFFCSLIRSDNRVNRHETIGADGADLPCTMRE